MQTVSDADVQFQKCDWWVGKKLMILHIAHALQYLQSVGSFLQSHYYAGRTDRTGLKLLDKQEFSFSLKEKKGHKIHIKKKKKASIISRPGNKRSMFTC